MAAAISDNPVFEGEHIGKISIPVHGSCAPASVLARTEGGPFEEAIGFPSAGRDDEAHASLVRERRAGRSRTIRPFEGPLLPIDEGVRGESRSVGGGEEMVCCDYAVGCSLVESSIVYQRNA